MILSLTDELLQLIENIVNQVNILVNVNGS